MAAVPTKEAVVALAEAAALLVAVAEALFEAVAEAVVAPALAEVVAAGEGNLVNKNIKKEYIYVKKNHKVYYSRQRGYFF
jgi:hypothetical protein